MAYKLNISQQAYSKIEQSNKIDWERLNKIATILCTTPTCIICLDEGITESINGIHALNELKLTKENLDFLISFFKH